MRCPREQGKEHLFEYTLMPTRIDSPFNVKELTDIRIHPGFDFTRGAQVMQIPASFGYLNPWRFGDKLFDVKRDPQQSQPLDDAQKVLEKAHAMRPLLEAHDAPPELYTRFALDTLTAEQEAQFARHWQQDARCEDQGVYEALMFLSKALPAISPDAVLAEVNDGQVLTQNHIFALIDQHASGDKHKALVYQIRLLLRVD